MLAPARRRERAADGPRLTDTDASQLRANVQVLLDNERPSEAISLLEDGIERAGDDSALELRLRHVLGAALFYAGEHTRAAALLNAVGSDYRRYFPATDPDVLDCSYYAGHAYAEIGNPNSPLRTCGSTHRTPGATADQDEAAKVLESRFIIAQMLAAAGHPGDALTELREIRPLLAEGFGADSTQLRNLDKQIGRLELVTSHE